MTRGLSTKNAPGVKKKKDIPKKASIHSHSQQPFSATTLSSSSQQPFSAAIFSSSSQQPFSAALLSHSQQLFSAAILSSSSQQPFSAATLSSSATSSSSSQKLFSAATLSSSSQQARPLFSSCCCGQGLVFRYSHHVAVVKGWWSAIAIMLLLSGVGGQLLSSCCCGQGLVVSYCHHVAVVRGWTSALVIMLLWSVLGGQLRTRSLEGPFRGAFGEGKTLASKNAQASTAHAKDPQVKILARKESSSKHCS